MLSLVEAVTRIKADVAKSIPQELVTKLCADSIVRTAHAFEPQPIGGWGIESIIYGERQMVTETLNSSAFLSGGT